MQEWVGLSFSSAIMVDGVALVYLFNAGLPSTRRASCTSMAWTSCARVRFATYECRRLDRQTSATTRVRYERGCKVVQV